MTVLDRAAFFRTAGRISASLERHFWRWAFLFVVLLLACSIAKDIHLKLWFDELLSLHMAQQAGPGGIVTATIDRSDGEPPLYAMIVASTLRLVKHQALALRLPATVGYCGMVLCLLAFCRRRMPAVYSFVTSLLACDACLEHSTEGRSYGIMLGCAAGALLCWQMATEGRRRVVSVTFLALCLALMTALHYYAIFFLVPLVFAEMVRCRKSFKPDSAILAAMLPAVLVLGMHYPLIRALQPFQAHSCSPAAWSKIPQFYIYYFLPLWEVLLFAAMALGIFTDPQGAKRARPTGMLLHEWVAIGTLALMPAILIAISNYTTHVWVNRHALWAVIGLVMLFGGLLCVAADQEAAVGVTVLGILVVSLATQEILPLFRTPVLLQGEAVRREIETLTDSPEPIVVANAPTFMELSYYAEPRLRERLIYPLNRDLELRYHHCDTLSLLMSGLSHHTKLHIVDYSAVVAAYPSFVLAAASNDYLPQHLVAAGYRVVPIRPGNPPVLYEVQPPETHRSGD